MRRAGHGPRAPRRAAQLHRDAGLTRQRHRRRGRDRAAPPTACCTCWPSRPSSASRSTSTTSTRSAAHAAHRRPAAGRPATGRPSCTRRAASAWSSASCSSATYIDGDATDRHRPDAGARSRPPPVETPGQVVVRPIEQPIKPTGGLAILRGIAGAGRLRHQAGRPRDAASAARQASSTRRPRASRP